MKTSVASLAIALLAAGCGDPSSFSELGSFTLQFQSHMPEAAESELHYDPARGCEELEADFSVMVNGEPALARRGGTYLTWDPLRSHCLRPGFLFSRPRPLMQIVTVEASCGGERQLVEIEGLGANLAGEPILAPGEAAHPGGSLQIALEPGFDRLELAGAGSLVQESPSQAAVPVTVQLAPLSHDGILKVTLPVTLPAGRTHLIVELKSTPRITRCEGHGECAWNTVQDKVPVRLDVAFDVAP